MVENIRLGKSYPLNQDESFFVHAIWPEGMLKPQAKTIRDSLDDSFFNSSDSSWFSSYEQKPNSWDFEIEATEDGRKVWQVKEVFTLLGADSVEVYRVEGIYTPSVILDVITAGQDIGDAVEDAIDEAATNAERLENLGGGVGGFLSSRYTWIGFAVFGSILFLAWAVLSKPTQIVVKGVKQ